MDVTGKINTNDPNDTNKEVRKIYEGLFGSALFDRVEYVLNDIVGLFEGRYPGYQRCDTGYHDLDHTMQAYLAMARLFNGFIDKNPGEISKEFVLLGLISAIGHDTGYIKEISDTKGSGAKYTLFHVERSKEFMGKYLPKLKYDSLQIGHVQNIIGYTGIPGIIELSKIDSSSDEEKKAGYILGTADYLGQMSSTDYIDKLPLLYEEFSEGGVPGYSSAEDLIRKTPGFFEDSIMVLLKEDFHSVYQFTNGHSGGKNIYIEGIKRNIRRIQDGL